MQKIFKHPELYNLLKKKNVFVNHGRELTKKIEKLEQERNKDGMQIQKIKDQILPIAEQLMKDSLGDFGMITTLDVVDLKGRAYEVVIDYVDQVEEYKKHLLSKKNNNENTSK